MIRRWSVARRVLPAAAILGCSGTGPAGGGADAGPGEDASLWAPEIAEPAPPVPPSPPAPAELPRMTPCPEGWREQADPDVPELVTCDPWPEGGQHQDCAEDEAHFPGGPGCERIGPPCPEGDWPTDLPEDARVFHVRAGEPDGGDGTLEQPFGWIADAVSMADDGDVIALSKGLFDEEVRIDKAVTVVGACVLETRIAPSDSGNEPAALTLRAAVVVRNLQVGGAQVGIDVAQESGRAEARSVLVREATREGITVSLGGELLASDTVVRDTRDDGDWGFGLDAWGRAAVTLERAAFERNRSGLVVSSDSDLAASDLLVSDSLGPLVPDEDAGGFGVDVWGSGQVTLARAVLARNRGAGLTAMGDDTLVTATDLIVSETEELPGEVPSGYGLVVWARAHVVLDRASIKGNRSIGLLATDDGTSLSATDLAVYDTLESGAGEYDGHFGFGLEVSSGAEATIERAVFERNRSVGVFAAEEGTVLEATDIIASDTLEQESVGAGGSGLAAQRAAHATIDRARFERNRGAGIIASDEAVLTITDLSVSDTLVSRARGAEGDFGYALTAWGAAVVALERAAFERNRSAGVFLVDEGTELRASDLLVSDTIGDEVDGDLGFGLAILRRAEATLERAELARNRTAGLFVSEEGTVLTATDLVISDTLASAGGERAGFLGDGIEAARGAQLELVRAKLERNRSFGIWLRDEGTALMASDLIIADTLSAERDSRDGVSLIVLGGADADIARARMADNRAYGLRVSGGGTSVTVADLVVERTAEQACAAGTCAETAGGFGMASENGATLDVRRFRSADNALVGALVASRSQLDLHDGVISGNPIGVNIQYDRYDLGRLQDRVLFVDNDVNTDSAQLPLTEEPVGHDLELEHP